MRQKPHLKPKSRAPRVLLVDSNSDSTRAFSEVLKLWGFEVRTAGKAADALKLARDEPADVALIDYEISGTKAPEIARGLRESGGKSPLMLAMTGWAPREERDRLFESGFDAYFLKPVDLSELGKLLYERVPGVVKPTAAPSATSPSELLRHLRSRS